MVTRALLAVLLTAWLPLVAATQGRRVVDVVKVGDLASEREHDFAGEDVTMGVANGRPYRQLRGWLSYTMAVYEDSEVTVVCALRGSAGRQLAFELFVEGRKIAMPALAPQSSAPQNVEFRIPFELTRGLTSIHVVFRAIEVPAPELVELRTVQEHLERPGF